MPPGSTRKTGCAVTPWLMRLALLGGGALFGQFFVVPPLVRLLSASEDDLMPPVVLSQAVKLMLATCASSVGGGEEIGTEAACQQTARALGLTWAILQDSALASGCVLDSMTGTASFQPLKRHGLDTRYNPICQLSSFSAAGGAAKSSLRSTTRPPARAAAPSRQIAPKASEAARPGAEDESRNGDKTSKDATKGAKKDESEDIHYSDDEDKSEEGDEDDDDDDDEEKESEHHPVDPEAAKDSEEVDSMITENATLSDGDGDGKEDDDGHEAALAEAFDTMVLNDKIHVCFCWEHAGDVSLGLQSLLVAINSTISNSAKPERLVFHLISTAFSAPEGGKAIKSQLPHVNLEVHSNTDLEERIASHITYRKTAMARKDLVTPFNFAAFYLKEFLGFQEHEGPRRLIYLDTDVVLIDDIAKLHDIDLGGKPVAAVKDCSQTFDLYIDFNELSRMELDKPGIRPKSCVFNRGVFLVDTVAWTRMKMTAEIELYMKAYKDAKTDLYKFGVSQPPWLLAIRDRYKELSGDWNCRGLGRETTTTRELREIIKRIGQKGARKLGFARRGTGLYSPYTSLCSSTAMLLHYNGGLKPWKRAPKWKKQPLCSAKVSSKRQPRWSKYVLARHKKNQDFAECKEIWSAYISPSAKLAYKAQYGKKEDETKSSEDTKAGKGSRPGKKKKKKKKPQRFYFQQRDPTQPKRTTRP
eukprot:TRINITY_DN3111_c1_g1_i1.p1 TRINITY_DN3111_c1_g1~~TRINITY_DN3111_c1_g1_i1.p1  ORF type:complete len:700 (-),score=185.89 TRINITY_DN3111_c1_g1_i1:579-2678(-)